MCETQKFRLTIENNNDIKISYSLLIDDNKL